ncbi:MAG: cation-transporting P-type ATPase, partial [Candidatus Doudnabacteria bacterium]|nr:cation-transporting P-type ATPase [Candidatus Doudnabacteria bacterium]
KTNPDKGLSEKDILQRQQVWGKNELPKGKRTTALQMFVRQFKSPLVYILLVAAVLTWWIGEYADMIVILVVVLANAIVGLFQEYRANKIFEKLKEAIRVNALVIRGDKLTEIDAAELVPGDLILLKGGNKVPADARLVTASNLETNEALLTGESRGAKKQVETVDAKAMIGDRKDMVFMGTVVERGEGRALVAEIGARTEIGKISVLTQNAEEEPSPLQLRMKKLGQFLSELFLVISLAIFILGLVEGDDVAEMIKTTVAVAVAAIPEGLPAAISIILAVSSQKILNRKGLVRKLVAAETLGSTSVICTDKTGTLTYGQMKVEKIIGADEREIMLSLALANEAIIEEKDGKTVKGEATDKAKLEKFLEKGDLRAVLRDTPRLALLPFDENRKYLASFHQDQGSLRIWANGAPETIISKSNLTEIQKGEIRNTYENYAKQGYRLIAAATKTEIFPANEFQSDIESMVNRVSGLTYLGLVAIRDPIREDVKQTMADTRKAGIKVLMVTGDHILTAKAIGLELGFSISEGAVILGEELDRLSDKELLRRIKNLEIIARVTPAHKMRIIDAWQKLGAVVAMTGDGVNDAPALKAADIGIAVGTGTDVSKEASDLVLLDDGFSTITAAISEGRTGFANIRKSTLTVMSNAFTEIILIASTLIFHTPFPITAIQILWVNLAEDSLPVLAMAFEPAEKEIMKSKPTSPKEPILDKESKFLIFAVSIVSDLTLVGIFLYLLKGLGWDLIKIQSFIFVATATPTLLNVFAFKSLRTPLYKINIFNNWYLVGSVVFGLTLILAAVYVPFFNEFLKTVPLGFGPALVCFAIFPLFKLILVELVKWRFRINSNSNQA